MYVSNTIRNAMLDLLDESNGTTGADFGGLNTAYSTSGANEVTGGSPAYARVALTWSAGSSGAKVLTATLPTWNVPASTTVSWFSGWTASTSGTFCFIVPVGGGTLRPCSVETSTDLTNNDIFSKAHGYTAGTRVVFWGTAPSGITIPEDGTTGPYFVIATGLATDSFRISTTSGGSAVDLTGTAPYEFFVQSCVPETFVSQSTFSIASFSMDMAAVA